jgi:hypothetical protein
VREMVGSDISATSPRSPISCISQQAWTWTWTRPCQTASHAKRPSWPVNLLFCAPYSPSLKSLLMGWRLGPHRSALFKTRI